MASYLICSHSPSRWAQCSLHLLAIWLPPKHQKPRQGTFLGKVEQDKEFSGSGLMNNFFKNVYLPLLHGLHSEGYAFFQERLGAWDCSFCSFGLFLSPSSKVQHGEAGSGFPPPSAPPGYSDTLQPVSKWQHSLETLTLNHPYHQPKKPLPPLCRPRRKGGGDMTKTHQHSI